MKCREDAASSASGGKALCYVFDTIQIVCRKILKFGIRSVKHAEESSPTEHGMQSMQKKRTMLCIPEHAI